MATKDGYAPDWFHSWGHDHRGLHTHWDPVKGAEVNLYLAKDDVPIRGRFLGPDGKPLAGARVRVTGLGIPIDRDLDAHLAREKQRSLYTLTSYGRELWQPPPFPGLAIETRTDADGRFTLTGLGRDRLADLRVTAPTVVDTQLQVMTRDGPDVGTLPNGEGNPTHVIRGAGFTLKLEPGLTVTGRVIDRDTREPVPGMWVGPLQNAVNTFSSRDAPTIEGGLRLAGLLLTR